MRALITGASGFAGSFLARECARAGNAVIGASRSGEMPGGCGEGVAVDLLDGDAVRGVVGEAQPDVTVQEASSHDDIVIYRVLAVKQHPARRFLMELKEELERDLRQQEILIVERKVEVL